MDTQGFDMEVFRGAGEACHEVGPAGRSVSQAQLQGHRRLRAVISFYESAGFKLAGLCQVNPENSESDRIRLLHEAGGRELACSAGRQSVTRLETCSSAREGANLVPPMSFSPMSF